MSEVKHTPGPWYVAHRGPENRLICNRDITVAEVLDDCHPDADQELANARLIAAAPELLEACQALVRAIDCRRTLDEIEATRAARKAISKATGNQSPH